MTVDEQLSAFLGEQPRQSRADLFSAEVMKRIERQVFVERLAAAAGGSALVALVSWVCAPILASLIATVTPGLLPVATILAIAAAAVVAGGPSVWRRLGWTG